MNVTEILIVVGGLETISKTLVKGLEDLEIKKGETIQTTVLLRSARILRRDQETQTPVKNHLLTLVGKFL